MTESNQNGASEAERQVLEVLWEHGPGTVRQVQQWLNQAGTEWQRSTVLTLLQRLEKKHLVRSDRSNFTFVFHAQVTRDDLASRKVQEVAGEFPGARPASVFLAFAERMKLSREDLAELRTLIDGLLENEASREKLPSRQKRRGGKANE